MLMKAVFGLLVVASGQLALAQEKPLLTCGDIQVVSRNPGHYAFGISFPVISVIDRDGKYYRAAVEFHSEGGNLMVSSFRNEYKLKVYNQAPNGFPPEYVLAIDGAVQEKCQSLPQEPSL